MSRLGWEDRFWLKVDKSGDCWLWQGAKKRDGYGVINRDGKQVVAHRISLEMSGVAIPEKMVVDHICHQTDCVRPAHLRVVTNKQNIENQIGAHRNSKSGVRGVSWHKHAKKWYAQLKHNGKVVSLGYFTHIGDAEFAVTHKRIELFTHNDADRAAVALDFGDAA